VLGMSRVRWTWGDTLLVVPCRWSPAKLALDTLPDLETQPERNQRRPVALKLDGERLNFANVDAAAAFLVRLSQNQLQGLGVLQGPLPLCEDGLRTPLTVCVKALRCSSGHPVQSRRRRKGFWLLARRTRCGACGNLVPACASRWHCMAGCNYSVCDSCYQHAAWHAANGTTGFEGLTGFSECEPSTEEGSIRSEAHSSGGDLLASGYDSGIKLQLDALRNARPEHLGDMLCQLLENVGATGAVAAEVAQHVEHLCRETPSNTLSGVLVAQVATPSRWRSHPVSGGYSSLLPSKVDDVESELLSTCAPSSPRHVSIDLEVVSSGQQRPTRECSDDSEGEDTCQRVPPPPAVHRDSIGAMFLLQTRLAKASRENEGLRERAEMFEMLRTRLDRATGESEELRERVRELEHALAEREAAARGGASEAVASVAIAGNTALVGATDPPISQTTTQTPFTNGEEVAARNSDAPQATCDAMDSSSAVAMATVAQVGSAAEKTQYTESSSSSSGKGKGKAKGPPVPGSMVRPADTPADAAVDQTVSTSSEAAAAQPDSGPKGKGKGKGKASGPPPAPPGAQGPGAGPKGKGKGKGTAVLEPTKPPVEVGRDLKSLPWTRFIVGSQIKPGATIWDQIGTAYVQENYGSLVPSGEVEERFAKSTGQRSEKAKKVEVKKPKAARIGSISQDERFQKEVGLKTLPPHLASAADAAHAIRSLDRAALPVDTMHTLQRLLCPSEEQEEELRVKRQEGEEEHSRLLEQWHAAGEVGEEPSPFHWDPVELYMEGLAQVPGSAARLNCWGFVCSLPDRVDTLARSLDLFDQMVLCFRSSEGLPPLLGLVLAFGNFLNGGRNQKRLGQADGFHVEALGRPGGLDVVNDTRGRNIRQLIFNVYFSRFPNHATQLLAELEPLFALVQRRLGKSDGSLTLQKDVRIQIEDLERQVSLLKGEFAAKSRELQHALTCISDPHDAFVTEMPAAFEQERRRVEELVERKDAVRSRFSSLLAHFQAETYRGDPQIVDGKLQDGKAREEMTSLVWCLIWDDFLIARGQLSSHSEKTQKEVFEPRLCKGAPLTVESLEMLWGLQPPTPARARRRQLTKETSGSGPLALC